MRLLYVMAVVLCIGTGYAALPANGLAADGGSAEVDAGSSLEAAFRKWHAGLSSEKKEDRLTALRSILPTEQDVAYLFPKEVDKLWPILDAYNKRMEQNVDLVAKEITRGGAIKEVRPLDVRTDKRKSSGSYKEVLAVLPKDVPLFDLHVEKETSASGGGTYVLLKGRWFMIRDLESMPELLKRLP